MRKPSLVRELLVAIAALAMLALAGCAPQSEASSANVGGGGGSGGEGSIGSPMSLTPDNSTHSGGVEPGGRSYYKSTGIVLYNASGLDVLVFSMAPAAKGGTVPDVDVYVFANSDFTNEVDASACTHFTDGTDDECNITTNNTHSTVYIQVSDTVGLGASYQISVDNYGL
ncbi:MAG TPA: hypothetical protein VF678_07215 [bacterium]